MGISDVCLRCGGFHTRNGQQDGTPTCRKHKSNGTACHAWKVAGLDCCDNHGGGSDKAKEAGRRRLAEAEAERVVTALLHNGDARPVSDAGVEMSRLAGILRDAFEAAGQRVNELAKVGIVTGAGGEQLRAEVQLWDKLIHHLSAILAQMEKLQVEQRLAKVTEENSKMFGDLLRRVIGDIGLTTEQQARVPAAVMRHLQAIEGHPGA